MSEPKGYKRRFFKSENSFNPYVGGKVPPGKISEEKGFCFSMTCRWIRLCMQHGIEGSARVMEGRELLHISIVHSAYRNHFPAGYSGAKNAAAEDKLVYEQSGLKKVWEKDSSEAMGALEALDESGLHYLEIGLPGHSVGWAVDMANYIIYYFDPNYGLYEYDCDDGAKILKHWAKNYGEEADFSLVLGR